MLHAGEREPKDMRPREQESFLAFMVERVFSYSTALALHLSHRVSGASAAGEHLCEAHDAAQHTAAVVHCHTGYPGKLGSEVCCKVLDSFPDPFHAQPVRILYCHSQTHLQHGCHLTAMPSLKRQENIDQGSALIIALKGPLPSAWHLPSGGPWTMFYVQARQPFMQNLQGQLLAFGNA